DHQTIRPSDHQTIRPSDHQTIRPHDYRQANKQQLTTDNLPSRQVGRQQTATTTTTTITITTIFQSLSPAYILKKQSIIFFLSSPSG
ncbi:MAG: hypothetical protein JXK95_13405, partial [Bacteroidales bacterium]|nr:hypothetical protein [Bacteroidales bacterium]